MYVSMFDMAQISFFIQKENTKTFFSIKFLLFYKSKRKISQMYRPKIYKINFSECV